MTPAQLLLAIAQHEPLEATLAAVPGLSREQAQRLLRGAAIQLAQASAAAPSSRGGERRDATPLAPSAGEMTPARAPQKASGSTGAGAPLELRALPEGSLRRVQVFSDGAARGNPGPAGAGAVLLDSEGHVLARAGRFLGRQTNNVAEYEGLLLGLRRAHELGAREVDVRADSLLMIKQLEGDYRVKNEGLKPLFTEARRLLKQFDKVTLAHVPREKNELADEMSNRAIDEKME